MLKHNQCWDLFNYSSDLLISDWPLDLLNYLSDLLISDWPLPAGDSQSHYPLWLLTQYAVACVTRLTQLTLTLAVCDRVWRDGVLSCDPTVPWGMMWLVLFGMTRCWWPWSMTRYSFRVTHDGFNRHTVLTFTSQCAFLWTSWKFTRTKGFVTIKTWHVCGKYEL